MKIKKIIGSIAVAVSLFALTSTASAVECTGQRVDLAEEIRVLAVELRCGGYPIGLDGLWNIDDPIWQWKGKARFGCEVHYKLSKLLDETNDLDQKDPPGNKNGKNENRGARNDLLDNKDIDAFERLGEFVATILNKAKLNEDGHDHAADAQSFIDEALAAQTCIGSLID